MEINSIQNEQDDAKFILCEFSRCLPMNLTMDDVSGVSKDRQRIGSSLADIDPMNIDSTVSPQAFSEKKPISI